MNSSLTDNDTPNNAYEGVEIQVKINFRVNCLFSDIDYFKVYI